MDTYKFSELPNDIKDKAIRKLRDRLNPDFEWMFEDFKESIEEEGFEDPEIQASLSNCQGDGLSFAATRYNKLHELFEFRLGKGKKKLAKLLADNCTQAINGNTGHYCYAHENDVDLYLDFYSATNNHPIPNIEKIIATVKSDLQDVYMELCKKLEREGYKTIEHEMSDEGITEMIEANEWEFYADGSRV